MSDTQALDIVRDPLSGAVPTWRLDEEPDFWETVKAFGWEPSELDAHVQPFPAAEGPVVDSRTVPLADDDTRPLRLAEWAGDLAVAS